MKIQKGTSLNPMGLYDSRPGQPHGISGDQYNKSSISFEDLLKNRVNRAGQDIIMPDKMPPINRNNLFQLSVIVRKQMNESLLNAFGDPGNGGTRERSLLNSMDLSRFQDFMGPAVSGTDNRFIPQETEAAPTKAEIEKVIEEASARYDVDPALTKAVVRAESDFNPECTSSKGAMGLMQLMPPTARELGVQNPYNPDENIYGGTRYLKMLLDRYDGDINLALSAYNWGMGNVERNPGKLPQETRTYIARVNRYYQEAKEAV